MAFDEFESGEGEGRRGGGEGRRGGEVAGISEVLGEGFWFLNSGQQRSRVRLTSRAAASARGPK